MGPLALALGQQLLHEKLRLSWMCETSWAQVVHHVVQVAPHLHLAHCDRSSPAGAHLLIVADFHWNSAESSAFVQSEALECLDIAMEYSSERLAAGSTLASAVANLPLPRSKSLYSSDCSSCSNQGDSGLAGCPSGALSSQTSNPCFDTDPRLVDLATGVGQHSCCDRVCPARPACRRGCSAHHSVHVDDGPDARLLDCSVEPDD